LNNVRFTLGARLTVMDLGGFRSEWRSDFSVGSVYSLSSEYYRPFSAQSRWFYAPRISASIAPVDLYSRSKRLAEYGFGLAGAALDLGYGFDRNNELRFGYSMGYENASIRIGAPELPTGSGRLSASSIRYSLYDVDNPVIPRSGQYVTSTYQYIDHAIKSDGGFSSAEISSSIFRRISSAGSLFFGAAGGSTFGHQKGIPQFFLGGTLRLGAYGTNEILTNQYFLLRGGYIQELGRLSPLFGEKMYLLSFYELAKPYGGVSPSRLPTDANGGLVVNTLFGPVFVGGAYGDTGHRKIYFQLGRIF
jgi:NTE family protein